MKKTFDAVKWVRDVRDKMYDETKHMTEAQKKAYHKKRARRAIKKFNIKFKSKD